MPSCRIHAAKTSSSAIRRRNKKVRDAYRLEKLSHAIYAFLYPTGCLRPSRVMIPVSSSVEVDKSDRCTLADLDFQQLFPTGTVQARLAVIPGTDFRIRNHYTIVAAADSQSCPVNKALQGRGFPDHRGNVLVIRHASRNPLEITHATSSDLAMVEFIVSQWLATTLKGTRADAERDD